MSGKSLAPTTIKVYQLTGQTDFTIPFEYLARKFVVVTLLGVDRKVLTLNIDYRFVNKTVISLTTGSHSGYTKLEIRRETSASERLVDFHDGSLLRAYDLNLSQVQTLHVAEEARDLTADNIGVNDDGDLDARGRRIANVGAGRRGTADAANMLQLQEFDTSTLNNAQRAEDNANSAFSSYQRAAQSQVKAWESEQAALDSYQRAAQSQVKAWESEQAAFGSYQRAAQSQVKAWESEQAALDSYQRASQSQVNAWGSEQAAKGWADRAEDEAMKLVNNNVMAVTVESVVGTDLSLKHNLSIGAAPDTDHAYLNFMSRVSGESASTRKGYIGLASSNTNNISVTAEKGDLKLKGYIADITANQVTFNTPTIGQYSGWDPAVYKFYSQGYANIITSDGDSFRVSNWRTDGTYQLDWVILRKANVGTYGTRHKVVDFNLANVVATQVPIGWESVFDHNKVPFSTRQDRYLGGSWYPIVTGFTIDPSKGFGVNCAFGSLTVNNSYAYPVIQRSCDEGTWQQLFNFNSKRLPIVDRDKTTYHRVNTHDLMPQGSPVGHVSNDGGMVQFRYGTSVATPEQGWNWVGFSTPFPNGTLAVILTNQNVYGDNWPRNLGSFNSNGFNVNGGGTEQILSYIAIGY